MDEGALEIVFAWGRRVLDCPPSDVRDALGRIFRVRLDVIISLGFNPFSKAASETTVLKMDPGA